MQTILNVVSSGLCVGCGGCEVVSRGALTVHWDEVGRPTVDLTLTNSDVLDAATRVCPFADESLDESQFGNRLWPELTDLQGVGRYLASYAGRIQDDAAIVGSSSGGLTTFLLSELLERGFVDGVIHVGSSSESLFDYEISTSISELMGRRKSRYFALSFANVLEEVRNSERRYAFVGVPCAVKSLRSVALEDAEIADRIRYYVGLVCGHTKSHAYAESLAWQMGVAPAELTSVDFRVKVPGAPSKSYRVGVTGSDGTAIEADTVSLVGGNWGHGLFQLGACNFCDDIFAETADIVFGDAWLPRFEADWRGTNLVVARSGKLGGLLEAAAKSGVIQLEPLGVEELLRSQAGNFRHRRVGLAVRLADSQSAGQWVPRKRVEASLDGVPEARVELIRQRRFLTDRSHELFAEAKLVGSLAPFLDGIAPLVGAYDRLSRRSLGARVWGRVLRMYWGTVRQAVGWRSGLTRRVGAWRRKQAR